MAFASLAVVLSVLLALASSLLNYLRLVRVGLAVFLAGVLILFADSTYSLLRLSMFIDVSTIQNVFIASFCVMWITALIYALAFKENIKLPLISVTAPLFYVVALLSILVASGTLHAMLIDICVIALIGIIVASREHRPHGLGRFVAAVLLPASLLIHTSTAVGAGLGEGELRTVISLLGYVALAAVVPIHPWFLRVITERNNIFVTTAAVSIIYLGYFGMSLKLSIITNEVTLWFFSMLGLVTLFYASAHAFARRDIRGCIAYYVSSASGFILFFTSVLVLLKVNFTAFTAAVIGTGLVILTPATMSFTVRSSKLRMDYLLMPSISSILALLLVSGAFPSLSLLGRALLGVMLSRLPNLVSIPALSLLALSAGIMSAIISNSISTGFRGGQQVLTPPLLAGGLLSLVLFYCVVSSLLSSFTLGTVSFALWLFLIGFISGFSAWLVAWYERLGILLNKVFTHFPSALQVLEEKFGYVAARVIGFLEIIETEEKFLATLSLAILLTTIVVIVFLGGVTP